MNVTIRAELIDEAAPSKTIAAIACAGGFHHLGEFNRQYLQLFGETPSATRRANLAKIRPLSGKDA